MHEKLIRQLTADLATQLVQRDCPAAPSQRAALALLRQPQVQAGLSALFPIQTRLTCTQVLEVCLPLLHPLDPPEGGWLPFCHRYLQHLMFPDADCFAPNSPPHVAGAHVYLTVLQVLLDRERQALPFDPMWDFQFLSPQELEGQDCAPEYRRLLTAVGEEYLYELMRLGQETTSFCTLSHIAGVHHVATTVARALHQSGTQIDLCLLSGAALSHDFGKFGCRPGERVPYLHYYYSDQWLTARRMESIAHIAANHSTWDLELDSLSVESLCLIYADFRTKQLRDESGRERTAFYSLSDSFSVILRKLDDVDGAKRRRYQLVYGRLRDFERYMAAQGVDVSLSGQSAPPLPQRDPALLGPEETVDELVQLSVGHNLRLMHHLSSERKFGNLIESARSAKNWQQLRAYLEVFGEYFTYLNVSQKGQALSFLYELLVHRDGDIRRQAAGLIGQIIARFHLVYRKELPTDVDGDPAEEVPFTLWAQYLEQIIYPDHKTTQQQRSHIGYTLKLVVDAMLAYSRQEDRTRFVGALLRYYRQPHEMDGDTAFTLLDAIRSLPPQYYDEQTRGALIQFAGHFTSSGDQRLQTAALQFLRETARSLSREHPQMRDIVSIVRGTPGDCLPLLFLRYKLLQRAGEEVRDYEQALYGQDITSEVFLDNLKIATPWIVKVVGIDLLRDQVEHGIYDHILHISTHFSNLVKVSERVVVRHCAGDALVRLIPRLRREQRNEVVVELGKGLEMGQYEISKYIPQYLGEAALYLHPSELDEQVLWLKSLLGSANDSAVAGALNTIGMLLQGYPVYRARFNESTPVFEGRRQELLGLLLQGLAHYREGVRQEALLVTGKLLFESERLDMEEKAHLFSLCYRKLLFLIREGTSPQPLTFYFRAAALSHLSRFISLWRLDHGSFSFHSHSKIAFFPGTFDPFTLSHKGIVHAIRDLGFEVYLAVDEFSWSKKSQPHLIRRQIVNLSVAGDFHVHLFPDDVPVNIASPADLKRLRALFPGQEVYLVVGSDVVRGASSYQTPPTPWSVHSMDHLIFHRAGQPPLEGPLPITGKVLHLQLPPHLEDISSTRIRENVDLNRDISTFIDPVIQDFIYQNGLYLRDSQDKPLLYAGDLDFQWEDSPTQLLISRVVADRPGAPEVRAATLAGSDRLLLLHAGSGRLLGYASYRYLSDAQLFPALGDPHLTHRVRLRAGGKLLFLTGLEADPTDRHQDHLQLLLAEVLSRALAEDCVYALFCPHSGTLSPHLADTLARQGFLRREEGDGPLLEVDMRTPLVLIQNLETTIQEPLCHDHRVLQAIRRGHRRLQTALTGLYPGSLVLTLSSDIIHHRLLDKITAFNAVPNVPTTPRQLGEHMCVPFGKLLRGKMVPNTVTKTIHTDKVYSPDLSENTIESFPYYAPIPTQIRTIHSFGRPVILVDDLMHQGLRIQALDPLFRQEEVDIRLVLVGVLSGYGRDLMQAKDRPVDAAYFLPSLRQWFVESTLYPFIGGNTVRRSSSPVPGLLPGINHILPYADPGFSDCSPDAAFALSRACLESARDVIFTLEQCYRDLYARNLTLSRLPEAVILPLCPDKGPCLSYDPNLSASVYLDNDLEQLLRSHGPL